MECEEIREELAERLVRQSAPATRDEVDEHLARCGQCREEWESLSKLWRDLEALPVETVRPDSSLRFRAMLEAYGQGLAQVRTDLRRRPAIQARWWTGWWPRGPMLQWTAALGLLVVGWWLGQRNEPFQRSAPRGGGTGDPTLVELRDEVVQLRQLVTLSLLQEPSASERLRGVQWSHELPQPSQEVLGALLRALDRDPNVNVRLEAIDALRQFASEDKVRQGLLQALADQQSPLVQIELINAMVELNERSSLPVLRELSQRPELDRTVRERAEWGLLKLG